MPQYQITSQVITTYQHNIDAESLEEAKRMVIDQEDDGLEVDSSPPELVAYSNDIIGARRV